MSSESCLKVSAYRQVLFYRAEKLWENFEKARYLLRYSMELDESTYLSSTLQLLVFIRDVNEDFHITEEMASVCSNQGTTTGKYIFIEVEEILQNYNRQLLQLMEETNMA